MSLFSPSGPGQLGVDGLLLPVLRTVRLRQRVSDRGVHGPLVAEGGVLAVVGASGALVLGVVVVRTADSRVRAGAAAVVLQVEGTVGHVLRRALLLLLAVVTGAQLLRLDLRPLLALALLAATGHRVLFGHPGAPGLTAETEPSGVRLCAATDTRVSMRRQVLVELVDVKWLHVGDDVAAQLTDVHGTKVDALLQRTALALQIRFAGRQVRFGGRGRSGGTLGLT